MSLKACTSEYFRKEISDLCKDCPLHQKLKIALEDQIVAQAKNRSESLSAEDFLAYVDAEIQDALRAMDEMIRQSSNKGLRMAAISEVYLWNKERIRVLKELTNNIDEITYGPQLMTVVANALSTIEALDSEGFYAEVGRGKLTKAKAVFRELEEKGWFKNKSLSGAMKQYSDLLRNNFRCEVSWEAFKGRNINEPAWRNKIRDLIPDKSKRSRK